MSELTKECSICKEIKPICSFTFQNKELKLYHSQCSGCKYFPKPKDGTNLRKCSVCEIQKHYKNDFSASQSCCKDCKKNRHKQSRSEKMENIYEFLKDKMTQAASRAKKKQIEFTVTLDQWNYIYFVKQRGLCALSGEYMTHKASTNSNDDIEKFPINISPDRINSNEGYTYENVQFVRWCLNSAKNDMEQSDFIKMCAGVTEYHKNPKEPHWTP
jgi:hypothetical protein